MKGVLVNVTSTLMLCNTNFNNLFLIVALTPLSAKLKVLLAQINHKFKVAIIDAQLAR